MLRGALKSAIIMKAVQVAQREARKPENQRKAREMFDKVRNGRRQGTSTRQDTRR